MFKRIIFSFFILLFLMVILGSFFTFYFLNGIFKGYSEDSIDQPFVVEEGDHARVIADRLAREGLIKSPFLFKLYSRLVKDKTFYAGKHILNKRMNIVEIIKVLTDPNVKAPDVEVRFIEGWTLEDMALYLEKERLISYDEFITLAKHPPQDLLSQYSELLDPELKSLEGYLFPDTYRIFEYSTAREMVEKMLDNLSFELEDYLDDIEKQGKTVHEVLTLASIIEREVQTNKDKKRVAGIFLNRIRKGMPLQADSTVNYITQKGRDRASYKDIEIDDPYNTYKYIGLPPGPISNPGIHSIQAAIYPEPNDYFFFLTTRDGTVYYGKTFEEHKANRQYLD